MMEFLSMRGRLSRSYTSFFARRWRPAEPSLNWIYIIRDPNDGLHEWREYMLAHYRAAAEASKTTDPVKIHDYMIRRAVEVPACMAILLDLRFLEILFMIRDSEKAGTHGDVPLFLTCMRFSLPLFAVTHATNYCHLVCDFLEWHKTASDADTILFENFFYTKLSNKGKPIWVDRGVEWTVRHIRMFMGHRVRPKNHDKIIERVVGEVPFRIRAKKELRSMLGTENDEYYTTSDWNDQTFRLGRASLHTTVALEERNLWGPGPLQGELESNSNDTIVLADSDGKEHCMSSSLLGAFDLGIDRSVAYFVNHHIRHRYQKSKSEKDNSLKLLPTTHERREKDINTTIAIRLSISEEEISPLSRDFPRTMIVEELGYLRDFEFPEMREYVDTEDRPTLVKALCHYRKRYFESNPDIYRETKESIEELEHSSAATTNMTRSEQIRATIYSLDDDAINDFRRQWNE